MWTSHDWFSGLQGDSGQMNASEQNSATFVIGTPQQINARIHDFAYSRGRVAPCSSSILQKLGNFMYHFQFLWKRWEYAPKSLHTNTSASTRSHITHTYSAVIDQHLTITT